MAIGLGLAVAYHAGSLWSRVLISKRAAVLAPALMVAGLIVRLMVLAAIVIPLALYTDLNLVALLVAFLVLFTILSVWSIYVQVKRSSREAETSSALPESSVVGPQAAKNSKEA